MHALQAKQHTKRESVVVEWWAVQDIHLSPFLCNRFLKSPYLSCIIFGGIAFHALTPNFEMEDFCISNLERLK